MVVKAKWRDNPWFPPELEAERQLDLELYPERYDHIWEGGYVKAFDGAYFAAGLAEAKAQGRIGHVAADPLPDPDPDPLPLPLPDPGSRNARSITSP